MNKIIISGIVVKEDPETRITESGKTQCKFRIASRRKYKNADGEYDADFFSCTAWGAKAEFVSKYVKKGSRVLVIGEMQAFMFKDESSGNNRFFTNVVVENIENYTWNDTPKDNAEQQAPYMTGFTDLTFDDTNEELPF